MARGPPSRDPDESEDDQKIQEKEVIDEFHRPDALGSGLSRVLAIRLAPFQDETPFISG
jgi:hypothetical protein